MSTDQQIEYITPGRWFLGYERAMDPETSQEWDEWDIRAGNEDQPEIAEVLAFGALNRADARLMSAAPALVEALAAFLGPDGHTERCRRAPGYPCLPKCFAAHGALALARGEVQP